MMLPSYVGRFEIRDEIATGGFAVVLRAWDEDLECFVALKILRHELAASEENQLRFLEEARLLRRIRSPHVVTVHDVGRLNDGRPYFVMDFADRGTLEQRLERRFGSRLPDPQHVMALVDALAEGVAAIHEAGLVHRDIKPANMLFQQARRGSLAYQPGALNSPSTNTMLVEADERILISDLGIAKDLIKHAAAATIVGGTPLYQAPEQGDPTAQITPAADVYAATAMLWHVMTGERPPRAGLVKDRTTVFPSEMRRAIEQGMAIDPRDRFDSMDSWRAAVHEALTQVAIESQSALPTEVASSEASCPYKGLAAFQPEDARFFFGREALIDATVRRIQLNRVLIVGGPSGSGKSSFVRAGLIPALKAGALPGSDSWQFAIFTPGRDPLAELYFQVTKDSPSDTPSVSLENFIAHPTMSRHLGAVNRPDHPLVLCIDQFEELFTLAPPAQQAPFVTALSAMTDPADSSVRILITVRADFYGACAQLPWLAERITSNQVLVGPMTPQELRRAITEPARPMGLHLEHGLVDAIIEESGNEAGSLPLVAHALVETWIRRKGHSLTLDGFRAAGGVAGAISQTADAIFKDQFNDVEREATERLFLRLVTPSEGKPDTRRILARSEIEHDTNADIMHRVVECLTEARLLTVDDTSVQIAHEALLQTWPRLRAWIEGSRDELRTRQRISRAASEWDATDRDPDLLYRGTPLLTALEWAEKYPDQLGEIERTFLEASDATRAKAEALATERQRRSRRIRRVVTVVLSFLALGATAASIIAFIALREARLNEERAELATAEAREQFAGALGVGARGMVNSDPLLALILAAESMKRAATQPPTYDARATMLAARQVLTQKGPFLIGSPLPAGDALAIALSKDGNVLASAQRDGVIDLIDTNTKKSIGSSLRGHVGGIRNLEFSPDNRWLVSAGADGTLRLWTVADGMGGGGRKIGEAKDVIMGLCFNPEGTIVATGDGDGRVQLWNVMDGKPIGEPLIDVALDFNVVEFSHDGRGLIASIHDGTIYGWQIPSRKPLFEPIKGAHTSNLLHIAFSPSGDRFATVSTDGTSMLLEYPSGRIVGPAFGKHNQIGSVVFSPDGRILIGGDVSGAIHLWDVNRQLLLATTPTGHTQAIVDAELSEDGGLLATLGRDLVIRLWSFNSTYPVANRLKVSGKKAKGIAFSNDGRQLAVGDDSGTVQIWELPFNRPLFTLKGHQHQVWAVAFAPDGRVLASGDRSGQIRLWNSASGESQRIIDAHDGSVWSLAFGSNGNQLLSISDEQVGVWDVQSGTLQAELKHGSGRNTRAVLSPDGSKLAVTATDGIVRVWDWKNSVIVKQIKADDDVLWSAAFSPDSRQLATASSDEIVTLWDIATGKQLAAFTGHTGGATDVAYLSDTVTLVAIDRNGRLHWWDTGTGRRISEAWSAHRGASWRLAVHPDGERFATTGDDGLAKVWDELSIDRTCDIAKSAFDEVRLRQYLGPDERSVACK